MNSHLLSKSLSVSFYILLLSMLFIVGTAYAKLPTLSVVEQQINQLNAESEPDISTLDKLQVIKNKLQEITALDKNNKSLQATLAQAPQRKIALSEKLQEATETQPIPISGKALASEIEQGLATEKARNKEWITQLSELKQQQQALLEAQETLPVEIAEQEHLIAKRVKESQVVQENQGEEIDKWVITIEQILQDKTLQGLVLQQDTLVQRRELAKINTQILEAQLALSSKQIELFQVRLLAVSTQSSLKVIEQAKQLSRTLVDAPDYIKNWNIKNETLAVEFEALNRQLLLTQQKRQQVEEQRQRVIQNLAQIKGNIKWLKNSPAFSDAISAQLQLLLDLEKKGDLAKAITAAHLKHFQLSTEIYELKDIPEVIAKIGASSSLSPLHEKVLSSILNFRYEVLNDALEKTDQFIAEITRLDVVQDQFYLEIQEERDFLREKRLFIRDRVALWELRTLDINVWFGTNNLLQRIQRLVHESVSHMGDFLLLGIFYLFLSVLIVQLKKVESKYRSAYAKVIGAVRKDKFSSTFILLVLAIGCGVLSAAYLFVIERWIAQRFSFFYSYDLGNIFASFCMVIVVWESLLRMAMPNGILQAHLGYSNEVVKWLKSTLSKQRWVLYSLLLSILFSEIIAENSDSLLLRIIFITLLFWLVSVTVVLLRDRHLPVLFPAFLRSKLAFQIFKIVIFLPLIAVTVLAVWGYFYTSWVVLFYYYATILCFIFAVLLQQLGVRWLNIEQRRISLQRALEKREERLQRQISGQVADDVEELVIPVEEVGEQSLTLLNLGVLIILFLMLSALLTDSLLALQWMDDVTIWDVVTTTETGNIVEAISLRALLGALVIFGLSIFSAKNIPGLLELLLLHRLNISRGATYAITTLSRYVIVIGGCLIGISILGFHWSRLQWLVAALSVGLGFGLQEIFANLVSGIILLFERPIRVGDTITIQGLSGTVMRINTRATTIQDWDKKDIIVPNKALITEQLVNWSLSDAMTRVIMPVGVAYGSDVQLVKKLLLQCARECDEITQDPEPQALFMQFGASSLDFELRVYLPQLEGRSLVMDKLNTRIVELFRLNNIEIPFPQMDVHIRDVPAKE